jgi:hypothetical protein
MNSWILHYIEISGSKEYIVITSEDKDTAIPDFLLDGYKFDAAYAIEDIGILPAETILVEKG